MVLYTAKKWIYARAFDGEPKLDDFRLEEEVMPAIKDGGKFQLLFEALFVSI